MVNGFRFRGCCCLEVKEAGTDPRCQGLGCDEGERGLSGYLTEPCYRNGSTFNSCGKRFCLVCYGNHQCLDKPLKAPTTAKTLSGVFVEVGGLRPSKDVERANNPWLVSNEYNGRKGTVEGFERKRLKGLEYFRYKVRFNNGRGNGNDAPGLVVFFLPQNLNPLDPTRCRGCYTHESDLSGYLTEPCYRNGSTFNSCGKRFCPKCYDNHQCFDKSLKAPTTAKTLLSSGIWVEVGGLRYSSPKEREIFPWLASDEHNGKKGFMLSRELGGKQAWKVWFIKNGNNAPVFFLPQNLKPLDPAYEPKLSGAQAEKLQLSLTNESELWKRKFILVSSVSSPPDQKARVRPAQQPLNADKLVSPSPPLQARGGGGRPRQTDPVPVLTVTPPPERSGEGRTAIEKRTGNPITPNGNAHCGEGWLPSKAGALRKGGCVRFQL